MLLRRFRIENLAGKHVDSFGKIADEHGQRSRRVPGAPPVTLSSRRSRPQRPEAALPGRARHGGRFTRPLPGRLG
jgi:hypothetical protein